MEFMQFHLSGTYECDILVIEGAPGGDGHRSNGDRESFVERYAPHPKLLPP